MLNTMRTSLNTEKALLTLLLLVTIFLRLFNLGYSDYIQDEVASFFYWGGLKNTHMSRFDYLLNEPRGPMNAVMGSIPHAIFGDYDNTFAQRIPFALFGIGAIIIFYFMVKKITGNFFVAFLAAFLFSTNGLVVAYGRVALYESVLFFFMFASLYFFSTLLEKNPSRKAIQRDTLLGSLLFSIAIYCHWDAIFIAPPIAYILFKFFADKKYSANFKFRIVTTNILLMFLVLAPFFIPYFKNLMNNAHNSEYVGSFVGIKGDAFRNREEIGQFLLYNPFLTFPLYIAFGLLGIYYSIKKTIFSIWMIVLLVFFRFFVSYSGLHFYNLFYPAVILVAIAFKNLLSSKFHLIRLATLGLLASVIIFLPLQSYLLFIDHKVEYPMEREKILFLKTRKYTHKDNLKHKTGFPHKRYWEEINSFVLEQNKLNNEGYGYYTNEDKGIARIYMDTNVVTGDYFYAIGIKRPLSFAFDFKFPQLKPKSTVHKIQNEEGETVVRIYKVGVRD